MEYQIIGGLDAEYLERLERRFWKKVQKGGPDDCWLWSGGRQPAGYGTIGVTRPEGHSVQVAHRVSYELNVGPIPPGMCVCHSCDVRPCTNPAHLFAGTYLDNRLDMIAKGRDRACKGVTNGQTKLTPPVVQWAYKMMHEHGFPTRRLSRMTSVSHATLYCLREHKSWKHVTSQVVLD